MVLKTAFNLLTRMHSRAATLKRLGSPNLYSPIRITPSNFFRYLEGPSQIVIRGREFIIPVDTIKGTATQLISFDQVPSVGGFYLSYGGDDTEVFESDAVAADIEAALQAFTGLENVTVTGNFTDGFLVTFLGVDGPEIMTFTMDDPPLDAEITIAESTGVLFDPIIKRADRIVDPLLGTLAIDEIIEMVDIGGSIMGLRCRTE